jgi:hypothetical protein
MSRVDRRRRCWRLPRLRGERSPRARLRSRTCMRRRRRRSNSVPSAASSAVENCPNSHRRCLGRARPLGSTEARGSADGPPACAPATGSALRPPPKHRARRAARERVQRAATPRPPKVERACARRGRGVYAPTLGASGSSPPCRPASPKLVAFPHTCGADDGSRRFTSGLAP